MDLRNFKHKIRIKIQKHRKKTVVFATAFLLTAVIILPKIVFSLPDTALSLAESELSESVSLAMDSAVKEYISQNEIPELYTVRRTDEGQIAAIDLNTVEANEIKSKLSEYMRKQLENTEMTVTLPLGNVLGSILFSGMGGDVKVRIVPSSHVESEIMSELKQAGINQTEQTVKIRLSCYVTALVGDEKLGVNCYNDTVLSKTLIVGKIPSSYTQIGIHDKGTEEWLNKYSN